MNDTSPHSFEGHLQRGDLPSAEASLRRSAELYNQAGAEDRFLKLLVAQMQNQDPLNPMDNAQVTSQMAQINTVTGLQKVNESIQTLGSRLLQSQAMQGASVIGHDVTFEGDSVTVRDMPPATHTRLPGYLRGKTGIVDEVYPRPVLYSDSVPTDGVSVAQPVYRVKFMTRDLWSDIPDSKDVLYNDCFEVYLAPAA